MMLRWAQEAVMVLGWADEVMMVLRWRQVAVMVLRKAEKVVMMVQWAEVLVRSSFPPLVSALLEGLFPVRCKGLFSVLDRSLHLRKFHSSLH